MNIGLRKWVLDHNAVGLLKNAQVFIFFFKCGIFRVWKHYVIALSVRFIHSAELW